MIRIYRNPIYGINLDDQDRILRGRKYDPAMYAEVYTDKVSTFPKDRVALLGSLRSRGTGDVVMVSDLAVLAINKKDLRVVRATLKAKNAVIWEARYNRWSNKAENMADMIQDALDVWSHKGRRWSNKAAQAEDASKGGIALAKSRADRRVPKRMALTIWRDERLDADEAIERINTTPGYELDWTRTSAYRQLGPRKLPTGPISGRK